MKQLQPTTELSQTEQALLIWKEGDLIKDQWILDPTREVIIGRSPDCAITVPMRWVSRQHARLYYQAKQFVLEDIGSKNGVFINGQRLFKPQPLSDGDVIQLVPGLEFIYVDRESTAPLPGQDKGRQGIYLDDTERQVYINGKLLAPPLSQRQYQLLAMLSEHSHRVYSRDEIIEVIWAGESAEGVTDDAIDALIRRTRQRLAELEPTHEFIVTMRGYGFKLDDGRG